MDYDGDIEELMQYAERKFEERKHSNPYVTFDDRGKPKLDIAKLAKAINEDYIFKTYLDTEEILIYEDGYYKPSGDKFIKAECQRRVRISSALTEHSINEIIGHIRRSTYTSREVFN
jgi:hypothetical protein